MSAESISPPVYGTDGASSTKSVQQSLVDNASAAVNSVQNHPVTQNVKDTVTNGPVVESIKNQTEKTSNEFSGLANASRTPPPYTAANGQNLTHYHSFFYTLLSWEHPRATAITMASTILFIFACRYLPILRWMFKVTYLTLGVTALAEVTGKFVVGRGVASSFRPRRYYKIPKETLEASLDDLEQLINFFVIEFQRILFAENPIATIAAFASSFVSYYLVKIVPLWGLALLSTSVLFLGPLIYIQNQEFIDEQINHASEVVSAQATQVKDLASQHAGQGFETVKAYTGAGAAKAQELVGSARQKMPSPTLSKSQPASGGNIKEESFPDAPKTETFPTAPKTDPSSTESSGPTVNLNGEPVTVS